MSGPVSDQHLAFVGPGERATNPNLFHGLLNLLEAGARLTGALAGYATGIGSQLLEQLVSNPTADTRELVRIIRDLEARGLDIDSAVALRALPNGDMGVYAIRDPMIRSRNSSPSSSRMARSLTQRPGSAAPARWRGTPANLACSIGQGPLTVIWPPGDIQPGRGPFGERHGEMNPIGFPK